jgi:predicted DNA-binding transcriptional regulator AlpA
MRLPVLVAPLCSNVSAPLRRDERIDTMDTNTALRAALDLLTQIADRACEQGAIAVLPPDFDDRYDELTEAWAEHCSQPAADAPPTLTVNDVMRGMACCRATLYRLIAAGRFPAPAKIGKASRWRESDIEAWQAQRLAIAEAVTAYRAA